MDPLANNNWQTETVTYGMVVWYSSCGADYQSFTSFD